MRPREDSASIAQTSDLYRRIDPCFDAQDEAGGRHREEAQSFFSHLVVEPARAGVVSECSPISHMVLSVLSTPLPASSS